MNCRDALRRPFDSLGRLYLNRLYVYLYIYLYLYLHLHLHLYLCLYLYLYLCQSRPLGEVHRPHAATAGGIFLSPIRVLSSAAPPPPAACVRHLVRPRGRRTDPDSSTSYFRFRRLRMDEPNRHRQYSARKMEESNPIFNLRPQRSVRKSI